MYDIITSFLHTLLYLSSVGYFRCYIVSTVKLVCDIISKCEMETRLKRRKKRSEENVIICMVLTLIEETCCAYRDTYNTCCTYNTGWYQIYIIIIGILTPTRVIGKNSQNPLEGKIILFTL